MSDLALFIHSTGMGPFMWTRLLADAPAGLATLTPTNRGYSPADLLARGTAFSIDDEVQHLKAQIPAGTTGLHLGGHSYGGLVALSLALASEVPVRSLWLYEPVLFAPLKDEVDALPDDAAAEVRAMYAPDSPFLSEEGGGHEPWLEGFVDYWNQPGTWAAMGEKAKFMARMVGWKMFKEVNCVATQAQPFGHYQLGVPMTLVRGEHTRAPAREMLHRLAEVNPHAQVDVLEGLGHMSLVGSPDLVKPSLQGHWARAGLLA